MDDLETLGQRLLAEVGNAENLKALETTRVGALGKKGILTTRMKAIGAMDASLRRDAGAALNRLKSELAAAIEARAEDLRGAALDAQLRSERIDVTLPARRAPCLLYTSPSPRDGLLSRMPSSA